jgi:hypothetical protein
MTQQPPSRRAWLRRLTVTTAVLGGVSGSVAGATTGDDAKTDDRPINSSTDGAQDACTEPAPDEVDVWLTAACTDGDAAVFCVSNDGAEPVSLGWRAVEPPDERIEFVGCQTVRVVGEFADVIFEATFVAGDGEIGNVIEPIGAVDGVRTFDVRELDQIPDDAIVGTVEAFRDDPVVPGAGDLMESNPEFDACQAEFFGEILVRDGSSGDGNETGETDEADAAPDGRPVPDGEATGDELESLTVPAETTTCFAVDAAAGPVAVQLFYDGALLAERTSAADVACPGPFSEDGPSKFDDITLLEDALDK